MGEKIDLLSTSLMVTEYCSLNCKLCLAYVPYYKEKRSLTLDEAKIILKNYFDMIDTVEKFSITGGEPLINPQINDIIKELLIYEKQITKEIIIITNGTIVLSEELLEILKSNVKIKVIVNNYGAISKNAFLDKELLIKSNIKYIFYTEENRYGWIDCRDHSLKHFTDVDRDNQASQCAFWIGKKYVINRRKMYTCTRSAYRIQEKLIPFSEYDYIDLLEDDKLLRREKLNYLANLKSSVSCAYCEGLTEKTPKYKAAEQLVRGE